MIKEKISLMDNLYKKIIFLCSHKRYEVLSGKLPFWVVKKNNCISNLCQISNGKIYHAEPQISKTSLMVFLNAVKKFDRTISSLSWGEIEFAGAIKSVKPIVQIEELESRARRALIDKGICICLDNPLLNDKIFIGDINIVLDKKKDYIFFAGDTILGNGKSIFCQERGMIFIRNITRIRKILSGVEPNEESEISVFEKKEEYLRHANPLAENICEECKYSVFVKVPSRKAMFSINQYLLFCKSSDCIMKLKDIFPENLHLKLEKRKV